jgi:hypothetical protein
VPFFGAVFGNDGPSWSSVLTFAEENFETSHLS